MRTRGAVFLLKPAYAVDHMLLLVFATAVTTIAADFGLARGDGGSDGPLIERVGWRAAVALGSSSLAIWPLGPGRAW